MAGGGSGRRLTPEEAALWKRVQASVRPIERRAPANPSMADLFPPDLSGIKPARAGIPAVVSQRPAPVSRKSADTLDGGWDKRLSRGAVSPDWTIDLHGHSLASAHAALDHGLEAAIARGDRVILLVTGKPPRPESQRPHTRGAIRAAIGDWLAGSRHAHRIAAIRGAHPRHGGQGALYLILRRPR